MDLKSIIVLATGGENTSSVTDEVLVVDLNSSVTYDVVGVERQVDEDLGTTTIWVKVEEHNG
jgi:hypothetical protein